jgi:RES domain
LTARLPGPPSAARLRTIGIRDEEYQVIKSAALLWRVHRTQSHHVLAWNAFRLYGPVLRFDPHPPPAREHTSGGIWCGASTPLAALAEAFQADRTIDRFRDLPYLTGLRPTRELRLLDFSVESTGSWATRAGGTYGLSTGPHSITQRWARRIVAAFADLDGVHYNSRFSGGGCVALFAPAADAMPDRPTLTLPLTHPGLASRIAGAAQRLGYLVI